MKANAKAAIILRITGPGWLMVIFVIARREATSLLVQLWIASRSLSSGAHSRDPLARK
jgi:hypothetical protein